MPSHIDISGCWRFGILATVNTPQLKPFTRRRWALWLFAAALLLKAAMPMLASASAQQQGKTLVEVCTAYGVATVALNAHGDLTPQPQPQPQPQPHAAANHGGDHCALSGLLAMAFEAPTDALSGACVAGGGGGLAIGSLVTTPDACAVWATRLHHAPPALT